MVLNFQPQHLELLSALSERPSINMPPIRDMHNDYLIIIMANVLMEQNGMTKDMSYDEVVRGLLFAERMLDNGYEYAKHLESQGWSGITANDVLVLDEVGAFSQKIQVAITAKWVEVNGLQPPCPEGSMVKVIVHKPNTTQTGFVEREIFGKVTMPDRLKKLGFFVVRDNEWIENHGEEGGYQVPWEAVEVIQHGAN